MLVQATLSHLLSYSPPQHNTLALPSSSIQPTMPSTVSASDMHRRHEQRLAKQKEQLNANSMPQKHDSQRSRQRMNEIQAYAEELRQQEAMAFSLSENERQILLRSFASVKFEFSDLDGLTWSPSLTRRRYYHNVPHYTKPYARSRMPASESAPFSVLSNKEISSAHPEETIRLKPSASLPSILSDGYHSSFSADQVKEDLEDASSEETLLSTPTQSHFELPQTVETPKVPSSFSIFSYDVSSSKLDSRRTFIRSQSFRQ